MHCEWRQKTSRFLQFAVILHDPSSIPASQQSSSVSCRKPRVPRRSTFGGQNIRQRPGRVNDLGSTVNRACSAASRQWKREDGNMNCPLRIPVAAQTAAGPRVMIIAGDAENPAVTLGAVLARTAVHPAVRALARVMTLVYPPVCDSDARKMHWFMATATATAFDPLASYLRISPTKPRDGKSIKRTAWTEAIRGQRCCLGL
jgi:hypothetical protein